MFQETVQDDLVRQRHRSHLIVMRVVLKAASDVGVNEIDEAVVGGRDQMRVPAQIVQNVFGLPFHCVQPYVPVCESRTGRA